MPKTLLSLELNLYIRGLLPKQARVRWTGKAQAEAGLVRLELPSWNQEDSVPVAPPGEAEGFSGQLAKSLNNSKLQQARARAQPSGKHTFQTSSSTPSPPLTFSAPAGKALQFHKPREGLKGKKLEPGT